VVGEAIVSTPPLHDKPSVAVLPFTNMSADHEQEFFADGIAEDVITALSRFPSFILGCDHRTMVTCLRGLRKAGWKD